jgi:DNA-binding GntR family transcriptional regulator
LGVAETTAERIARVLAARIVSGELAPGAPLRQDHIAEEFESSHVPAREAFQRLQAQGLAVSQPRRGMRVAPLDPAAMQETVEIRVALETLALTQAAPRLTAASFDKIERALVAGEEARTMTEWEQANRAFHFELAAPCKMPRLLAMLDELQLANARIIFSAVRSAAWQPGSAHDHRQIVSALKQRDVAKAVIRLQRHIRGLERAAGGDEDVAVALTHETRTHET